MSADRIDWAEYLDARIDEQSARHLRSEEEHAAMREAMESLRAEQVRIATVHRIAAWLTALIATSAIALGTWLVRTTLVVEERVTRSAETSERTSEQVRELTQAVSRIEGRLER